MSTLNRKRDKGELVCGLLFMLLGVIYGSAALRAERHHGPFHIWHKGYLVTDSPDTGLFIGGIFIFFGALLVALFLLSGTDTSS